MATTSASPQKQPADSFVQHYGHPPAVVAYAPGRLEFIGNHTDYNHGEVLGAAIDLGVTAMLRPREDRMIALISEYQHAPVTLDLGRPFSDSKEHSWINYPTGVLRVLIEEGFEPPHGFDIAFSSSLPTGAGMSSSAALELATLVGLEGLYGLNYSPAERARIARRAENKYVGVPCGILDQGVSAFGRKDHLVHIDCAHGLFARAPLPAGLNFWVFNTQKKHALVDSLYSQRHAECMRALDFLQQQNPGLAGLALAGEAEVESLQALDDSLPYRRARHVASENQRVKDCLLALQENAIERVGQLLFESHASSRDWFENSCPELDALVDTLHDLPGVIGARLTGGGFGGAVMALTRPSFGMREAEHVAAVYKARFGHAPTILQCSTGNGATLR